MWSYAAVVIISPYSIYYTGSDQYFFHKIVELIFMMMLEIKKNPLICIMQSFFTIDCFSESPTLAPCRQCHCLLNEG